jgi:hypothetical protein
MEVDDAAAKSDLLCNFMEAESLSKLHNLWPRGHGPSPCMLSLVIEICSYFFLWWPINTVAPCFLQHG